MILPARWPSGGRGSETIVAPDPDDPVDVGMHLLPGFSRQ
jgi:hypothetical protein